MAVHEAEHVRSIVVTAFGWSVPGIAIEGPEFHNQDRFGRQLNDAQLASHDSREHPWKDGIWISKHGVCGVESVAGKTGVGLKMLTLRPAQEW